MASLVKSRSWRDASPGERIEIIREHHTSEVKDVPPEIIARIETLEDFARTVADQINRCNADILAARQEIAALLTRVVALETTVPKHDHGHHDHPLLLSGWVVINGIRHPVEIINMLKDDAA